MLKYEVSKLTVKDLGKISKIILEETDDKAPQATFLKCCNEHLAWKMEYDGKLAGFCLAEEFSTHYSWTYYYILPEFRKKIGSLLFFNLCLAKLRKKPIFVHPNSNIGMYDKYFHVHKDNMLQFKGLREIERWNKIVEKIKPYINMKEENHANNL